MSICWIMKVFQVRVSLIITRKIYSIIVLSNVPVVLITLDFKLFNLGTASPLCVDLPTITELSVVSPS